MGVASIDDVLENVQNSKFKELLEKCKDDHNKLKDELQEQLDKFNDDGKNPNPIAKSMSWMKTNAKLAVDESDNTIADLMTEGCNMGVKSLCRYLNQYKNADDKSKAIAKKLIKLERNLTEDICIYL